MRWIRTLGLHGLAMMALGLSLVGTATAQGTDKFQDILSKGVVRIGVPVDAPPFGSQSTSSASPRASTSSSPRWWRRRSA